MTTVYKLTDQDGWTRREQHNAVQWVVGETYTATGDPKQGLCSDGYLHAYEDPIIAVLLNPAHANIPNPKMFELRGTVEKREGELKCGLRSAYVVKEVPIPAITLEQRVVFAICCAWHIATSDTWKSWAKDWLRGVDRTEAAAWASAAAAWASAAAARSAEWAARASAAWSAEWATTDITKYAHYCVELSCAEILEKLTEGIVPISEEKQNV